MDSVTAAILIIGGVVLSLFIVGGFMLWNRSKRGTFPEPIDPSKLPEKKQVVVPFPRDKRLH